MKRYLISCCFLLLLVGSAQAQSPIANTQKTLSTAAGFDPVDALRTLFSESEIFIDKANFVWVDYQLLSNRGQRTELTKTVLPSVGLHYERQLWKGLGVRVSGSANWWQESRTLAETTTEQFNQLYDFRYLAIGVGPTYHLNVNRKWDPFFGLAITYRRAEATCPCYTLTQTSVTGDLHAGARYFAAESFFLMAELGQNGTGYLKLGTGFKF